MNHVTDDEIRASLDAQRKLVTQGQNAEELESLAEEYDDTVIEHSKTCPKCGARTVQILLEGMFETVTQAIRKDFLD